MTRDRQHPLLARLFAPVDAASLVAFRVSFGVLMLWPAWDFAGGKRLHAFFLVPIFHFKHRGIEWLEPAPDAVLWALAWLLLLCAAGIALGAWSRVCCAVFGAVYGYFLLLDKAAYNNHDYLIALIALALACVPAHRPLRNGRKRQWPPVPAWALAFIRFHVALPYFFGGVAKLQGDWLLRAQPMRIWLAESQSGWLRGESAAYVMSWAGALFDLAVVPLLLWRRTRPLAATAAVLFHLANAYLFHIAVFPWLMIAATLLFFPPDWPRRFAALARRLGPPPAATGPGPAPTSRPWVAAVLAAYAALHVYLPLRHVLYPGNVDWTERGHTFAWRMKMRDKRGTLQFVALKPQSQQAIVLDEAEGTLTERQWFMMRHDPDMIRQFAHFVAGQLRAKGYGDVEVRAITAISFNGRPRQPMVKPEVALSEVAAGAPYDWIEPLRR